MTHKTYRQRYISERKHHTLTRVICGLCMPAMFLAGFYTGMNEKHDQLFEGYKQAMVTQAEHSLTMDTLERQAVYLDALPVK